MSEGEIVCFYCDLAFADKLDRDFHWYADHFTDLSDEDKDRAFAERNRRFRDLREEVTVPITFSQEQWEFIVKDTMLLDQNPEDVQPTEREELVHLHESIEDLIDVEYDIDVEGRIEESAGVKCRINSDGSATVSIESDSEIGQRVNEVAAESGRTTDSVLREAIESLAEGKKSLDHSAQ